MSTDFSSIDRMMADFKGPLQETLDRLENERRELIENHRASLGKYDTEIARYKKILRAAFPDEFSTQQQQSSGNEESARKIDSSYHSIPPEKLDAIRRFIFRHLTDQDSVSQVDVRLALGYDSGTTSTAFRLLRQDGMIRQSGQVGNKKFFKLTKDAQDQLDKEMEREA